MSDFTLTATPPAGVDVLTPLSKMAAIQQSQATTQGIGLQNAVAGQQFAMRQNLLAQLGQPGAGAPPRLGPPPLPAVGGNGPPNNAFAGMAVPQGVTGQGGTAPVAPVSSAPLPPPGAAPAAVAPGAGSAATPAGVPAAGNNALVGAAALGGASAGSPMDGTAPMVHSLPIPVLRPDHPDDVVPGFLQGMMTPAQISRYALVDSQGAKVQSDLLTQAYGVRNQQVLQTASAAHDTASWNAGLDSELQRGLITQADHDTYWGRFDLQPRVAQSLADANAQIGYKGTLARAGLQETANGGTAANPAAADVAGQKAGAEAGAKYPYDAALKGVQGNVDVGVHSANAVTDTQQENNRNWNAVGPKTVAEMMTRGPSTITAGQTLVPPNLVLSPEQQGAIDQFHQRFPDFVRNVNATENPGGNPAAPNASGPGGAPTSSAVGNGQFIAGTWLQQMAKLHPEMPQDTSAQKAAVLALRSNPQVSDQVTASYGADNAAALTAAGLPAVPPTMGLAHRFGGAGAVSILKSDPGTPLARIVPPGVIAANPDLRGMTTGQIGQRFMQQYAASGAPAAGGAVPAAAAAPGAAPAPGGALPPRGSLAAGPGAAGAPVVPAAATVPAPAAPGAAAAPAPDSAAAPSFKPVAPPVDGMPTVTTPPPDLQPTTAGSAPQLVRGPGGTVSAVPGTGAAATAQLGEALGKIPAQVTELQQAQAQLVTLHDDVQQNARNPAFLQSGWADGARTDFANGINTLSKTLGLGPIFSEQAVGSNQAFAKASSTAAFSLARSMGGQRLALGEVLQANRSVPNQENNQFGNTVVTNLLLQENTRQIDRARYQMQQGQRGVDVGTSGDAFDQANPPAHYVAAGLAGAVSENYPRSVAALRAAPTPANVAAFDRRYGQGTSAVLIGGTGGGQQASAGAAPAVRSY